MRKCLNCENTNFYETLAYSRGTSGPELLPGTGAFSPARFKIQVCAKCGFIHWAVADEDLDKIKRSKKFTMKDYK